MLKKENLSLNILTQKDKLMERLKNSEEVTIYRGIQKINESLDEGLSYSLSRSVADFFCNRFSTYGVGDIITKTINVKDVALFFDTSELEVIYFKG